MVHPYLHPSTLSSSFHHHFLRPPSLTSPFFSYIHFPLSSLFPFFLTSFITHIIFFLISQPFNVWCSSFHQYNKAVISSSLAALNSKNPPLPLKQIRRRLHPPLFPPFYHHAFGPFFLPNHTLFLTWSPCSSSIRHLVNVLSTSTQTPWLYPI